MTSRPALPALSLAQLDYLVAVADEPTWTRAAEQLGVSTSALSQSLAEVERRLGVALFERSGRQRVPTATGDEVIAYARGVVAQTHDLAAWLDEVRSGRRGHLRLGMIDSSAIDHHPAVLRAFRDERPEVELRLTVAPSGSLVDLLTRGELDLAVCVAPPTDRDDLVVVPLLDEPLALYAPDGRPAGAPATWGPFVSFPAGSHTRTMIERAVVDAGGRYEVVAESHQPDVLREMVRLGAGWAVLPAAQAERPPHPLVPARSRPLLHRTLVAARRRHGVTDPVVDQLVEHLTTGEVRA